MKICMIGSLIPLDVFDGYVAASKVKPSSAPIYFQRMIAQGFSENRQNLVFFSFPNVACYPNGPYVRSEKLSCSFSEHVSICAPSFINILGIKQITIFLKTVLYLLKYIKQNKKEQTYVITYSNYPPYARAVRYACRLSKNAHAVLMMADLPTYRIHPIQRKTLHQKLVPMMERMNERDFTKYDAYILLTKYMAEGMNIKEKPFIVVEGFSDRCQFMFEETKTEKKTLMYAGSLTDIYNIQLLIDAFRKTDIDANLWIFGSGNREEMIREAAKADSRITFFGKVSREELLHRMKQADLLVSVKSTEDGFARFSFPSKILEYMTSGTPVLTTRVAGIPDEYFQYVYTFDECDAVHAAERIKECLMLPRFELQKKGAEAFEFVSNQKNCKAQTMKIVSFLKSIR